MKWTALLRSAWMVCALVLRCSAELVHFHTSNTPVSTGELKWNVQLWQSSTNTLVHLDSIVNTQLRHALKYSTALIENDSGSNVTILSCCISTNLLSGLCP